MKIFKVPFGSGGLGKTIHTANAPDIIISELQEMFMNENYQTKTYSIHDIPIITNNVAETHTNIQKIGSPGIFIGGDHSITYSSFIASKCDGLLILDAHPDLMEGTDSPSHEDYLRKLIEDNKLNPLKTAIIGIRNPYGTEIDYAKSQNITTFSCKDIDLKGIDNVCDSIMEKMRNCKSLYISIDIDVIDPAFAPATNHREPAGLTPREVLHILQRLKYLKNIKSADVVEVDPTIDINNITSRLAAKIIYELLY